MNALPQIIGPYQILEALGHGGMGVVYRAEHLDSREAVALKTVLVPKEGNVASLRREIHALARVCHPGIVRIVDEGIQEGIPWYAMELLHGQTLRRYSARRRGGEAAPQATTELSSSGWWTRSLDAGDGGRPATRRPVRGARRSRDGMPLRSVLTLVRRLCGALSFLHGEGLVHRDLKPDNVLVVERRAASGERRAENANSPPMARSSQLSAAHWPVIVDFGLTSRFGGALSREELEVRSAGEGTLAYMAPEQHVEGLVDARADLYSLGCILYELLTGHLPFEGTASPALILERKGFVPIPPSQLVPSLPPELDELVLRLLAFEPRQRIGHADLVAARLLRLGATKEAALSGPRPRAYLYRPRTAGREEQLRSLKQLLKRLQAGSGGAVLIGGESGVGKTRLLMELAQHARRERLLVLNGECLPDGGSPLEAMRRPLQQVADRCRELGLAEAERLFGLRGKILAPYEPALAALPGQEAHREPAELPPEAARVRLYGAVAQTLSALAEARPVLLLLDDLQWMDELSLGLLEFLLKSLQRAPTRLLVLGAYRIEEAAARVQKLLAAPGVLQSKLTRLAPEAVGVMVGDMLAVERPPEPFVQFLARQSEGNPFFVAEFLRTAVAEGILYRDQEGRWQGAREGKEETTEEAYEALPLPHSVRELVGRRLDGLEAGSRQIADAAAVLGREVDRNLLARVARVEENEALEALNELLLRQILEEDQAQRLRFVHDKIREVAYERLGRRLRRRLHRAAAEALEERTAEEPGEHAAALGQHWEKAGSRAKARQWYLAAARHAKRRHALDEAERLYRASLRLFDEPAPETVQARNELGFDVLRIQGRIRQAIKEHRKALQESRAMQDRAAMATSLRGLGWNHYALGQIEEACAVYEQALAIAREAKDRAIEGNILTCLALAHADQGRHEQARRLYEQAIRIDRERRDKHSEGNDLGNLAIISASEGRLEEASALLGQALSLQRAIRNRLAEGVILTNLAALHQQQGRLEQALPLCEQALAIHRETGHRSFEGVALSNLAELYADLGPLEQARTLYDQALTLHRELGSRRFEGITLCDRAALERRDGQLGAAQALLRQAQPILREVRDALSLGLCLCEQGHLALSLGRPASKLLGKARELAEGLHAGPESKLGRAVARLDRAVVALDAGRPLVRGECPEDLPGRLPRGTEGDLPRGAAPKARSALD
jgi:serine/threonine protein kinase/tetratricopeptide (TPR) repeat protein